MKEGCLLRCNVHTHPDDPMHMHVKAVHQNNNRLKQVPHIESNCRIMRGVKLCVLHYDNRTKGKSANAIGAITTYGANVAGSNRWMDVGICIPGQDVGHPFEYARFLLMFQEMHITLVLVSR